MSVSIRTNNHYRDLISFYDLPEQVKPDFDYIEGEDRYSTRLVKYRGDWYDTKEFFPISQPELSLDLAADLRKWHGYQSDSFCTGTVIRFSKDFEQVQIGSYLYLNS